MKGTQHSLQRLSGLAKVPESKSDRVGIARGLEDLQIPLAFSFGSALVTRAWVGAFSAEPEVLAVGAAYLRTVGPAYGFFGLGLALYFAAQGGGRLFWPLLASFVRLAIAAGGGWVAITWFGCGP